jgi:hypothetical protein
MVGCRNGGAAPPLTEDVEAGKRGERGGRSAVCGRVAWGESESWAVARELEEKVEEEAVCKSSLPLAVMGRRPATVLSKVPAR